jgi:hypothetical protein
MSEPKKASEVLLGLDDKIDTIMGMVQLYDTNLKLILAKVNQTYTAVSNMVAQTNLSDLQKEQIQQQLKPFQNPEAVEIPKGVPIKLAAEFPGQRRVEARGTANPNAQSAAPQGQIAEKASKEPTSPPKSVSSQELGAGEMRKIPVTQRVQADNKDVFMADITIFSMNKEVVAKAKSNALGKYNVVLSPGKYIVSIVKTDNTTKRRFGGTQEITVNGADKICSLSTIFLDRNNYV